MLQKTFIAVIFSLIVTVSSSSSLAKCCAGEIPAWMNDYVEDGSGFAMCCSNGEYVFMPKDTTVNGCELEGLSISHACETKCCEGEISTSWKEDQANGYGRVVCCSNGEYKWMPRGAAMGVCELDGLTTSSPCTSFHSTTTSTTTTATSSTTKQTSSTTKHKTTTTLITTLPQKTHDCYISTCGCPSSFMLGSWCANSDANANSNEFGGNALSGQPWCRESSEHCGDCHGRWCPKVEAPSRTGDCYLESCGCPSDYIPEHAEWCSLKGGLNGRSDQAFCRSSKENCSKCKGGQWCEGEVLTEVRSPTTSPTQPTPGAWGAAALYELPCCDAVAPPQECRTCEVLNAQVCPVLNLQCGPANSDYVCDGTRPYCNEETGFCGSQKAQDSTAYDWTSVSVECRPSPNTVGSITYVEQCKSVFGVHCLPGECWRGHCFTSEEDARCKDCPPCEEMGGTVC